MPQLIGALIITGIEAAFGVSVPATIFGTVSTAAIIGNLVIGAILIGLAVLTRPDVPKPSDGHQATRQEIPPRIMGFGRARVGGNYMLYEVGWGGVSWDVIALVEGKVAAFVRYFLHDDPVTIDGTTGVVLTTPENADERYKGRIVIRKRYGLPTETAYSQVVTSLPSVWTNNHRLDGVASIALGCVGVKPDKFLEAYPRSLPVPSVVVDFPWLWDPRDPDQDPDDPATWGDYPAWDSLTVYAAGARVRYTEDPDGEGAVYLSRVNGNVFKTPDAQPSYWVRVDTNPILQLIAVYTSQRYGLARDWRICVEPVVAALMAEANLCDQLVQKKNLDYEPRYASNGWFTFETEHEKKVATILATCDGWLTERGDGALIVVVGVYRAPTGPTLTHEHIYSISAPRGLEDERAVNLLLGRYTSPGHKYKEAPLQPWRNDEDIAERGVTRSQTVDLTWVQSYSQGRRLLKRQHARLNAPIRGTMTTSLYGLAFTGRRWIPISYPDAGIEFGIVEVTNCVKDIIAAKISFEWVLINANTIDAWDPEDEEGAPPALADNAPDDLLPIPEDIDASITGDATNGYSITITFDDPDREDLSYVVRYRTVDDGLGDPGPWLEAPVASVTTDGVTVTVRTPVVTGNRSYAVQVASVGPRGTYSEWSDSDTADAFDNTAPGLITGLNLTGGSGQIAASWTAPNSPNFVGVKIYRNTSNTLVGATLAATVYGSPSQAMIQTISGYTAGTRWMLITSINGSGIESAAVSGSAVVT